MQRSLRGAPALLSLTTALVTLAGCQVPSACDPPGGTAGVFVRANNSDAYLAEIRKADGDVPHVACRAETTIAAHVLFLKSTQVTSLGTSDPGREPASSGGKYSDKTPYDPRVLAGRKDIGRFEGQYRVVGIGRGLAPEDCAAAAMQACDQVIDSYYRKNNAVRPLGVPCRLLDDRERCPAGPGWQTQATASAGPEAPARGEPPIASLVRKLDDDRTRPDAVKGIAQFFENAKKRADGEVGDASVKALLDRVIDPMTKTYVDGRLDEKTRGELIRFLAETRDARAGRAWIKALASEDDAEWGALGIGGAVYQEGAPALGEAFAKLEAGTPKGSRAAENLHDAMLTLKNPTWTTMLLERLDHPMQKPDAASDSAKIAYQNELFWQTTSAELVGELHDPAATKTLLKVIMDPAKSDVAPAALLGIVNIGKQAVPFLIDVLDGKDPELTALAKSKAVDNGGNAKTHLAAAALALGEIGRADARDALVRASKTVDHDANRASLALALTELARSADAEKAFQAAYEKLSPGATTAFSSAAARPRLLDAAARFYDPALVPWLLKQVSAAKGPDADDVRAAGLRSALLLMRTAQTPVVRPAVDKLGTEASKEAFRTSSRLVESCDTALDCYAVKLLGAESGADSVKAASMLGVYGDAKTAPVIVERLARIPTAEGRHAALAALDHCVRSDGNGVADALEAQTKNGPLSEERAAVRRVALRLRAR